MLFLDKVYISPTKHRVGRNLMCSIGQKQMNPLEHSVRHAKTDVKALQRNPNNRTLLIGQEGQAE